MQAVEVSAGFCPGEKARMPEKNRLCCRPDYVSEPKTNHKPKNDLMKRMRAAFSLWAGCLLALSVSFPLFGQEKNYSDNHRRLVRVSSERQDADRIRRILARNRLDAGIVGFESLFDNGFAGAKKAVKGKPGVSYGYPGISRPVSQSVPLQEESDPSKANLVFVVEKDWGDGSGYHLLMDADHDACGRIFTTDNNLLVDEDGTVDYGDFEVLLPEGAYGSPDCPYVVSAPGRASVAVEPGTYDYVVLNPTPGDKIYMAGGDAGLADDMYFAAGSTYTLTVLPSSNGGDSCHMEIDALHDLELVELQVPADSEDLGAAESIAVKVRNRGKEKVSSFVAGFRIDTAEAVTETVTVDMAPGAEYVYTFETKVDMSRPDVYRVRAEVLLADDAVSSNNSAEARVDHKGPRPAPFLCNFDLAEDWLLWKVIDSNQDGTTWIRIVARDAYGDISGFAHINYNTDDVEEPMDDYLVMANPVSLKRGTNHVAFHYDAGSMGLEETLELRYGKTDKVDEMQVLKTYKYEQINNYTWHYAVEEFDLPEDGAYFFAFHACSEPNTFDITIDNIVVDTGIYRGTPDLEIVRVLAPVSACGLGEQVLGAIVTNKGDAEVSRFNLTYMLNGRNPVSQSFDRKLGEGDTLEVYFDQKAVFDEPDGEYEVEVSIAVEEAVDAKAESELENNTARVSLINFTPARLPFYTDFSNSEARIDWTGEFWSYDTEYEQTYWAEDKYPLVSRCVTLRKDVEHKFEMEFKAGLDLFGYEILEHVAVLYGPTGTDLAEWDTLVNLRDCYTREDYEYYNKTFTVGQEGDYSFAVVAVNGTATFYLRSVKISAVLSHDVAMTAFSAPSMVPVEHFAKGIGMSVTVKNNGQEFVDRARILLSDTLDKKLGEQVFVLGESGSVLQRTVSASGNYAPETDLVVDAEVSVDGYEDADVNPDNELSLVLSLSDSLYAYDRVTDAMMSDNSYGVGSQGDGWITVGIPFTLHSADTLTGFSIAWHYSAEGAPVDLAFCEWDSETLEPGRLLYSASFEAGYGPGWKNYATPGLLVDSGTYMFCLQFSGPTLTMDLRPEGIVYVLQSNGNFVEQADLGYPGMRLLFGHGGRPVGKDMALEAILSPVSDGFYGEEEEVVLQVSNFGYQANKADVYLLVNKEKHGPVSVELDGYAKKEVRFKADLSQPESSYLLTAYLDAEQDVNRHNDTAVVHIGTVELGDPYLMDFELSNDFSMTGFNPEWTTYDGDAQPTAVLDGFTYPGMGEACAFMVFNPSMTQPSALNSGIPANDTAFMPWQGDKYGVSFCSSAGVNNDWLISPKLRMAKYGAKLTFRAKSLTAYYGKERFNVLISSTDNKPESFTKISSGQVGDAAWEEITVDLSTYAGKDIHVAIQCVSQDAFLFMIDDIRISRPTGNELAAEGLESNIRVYPNPASDRIWIRALTGQMRSVEVYNAAGSLVAGEEKAGTVALSLQVSDWAPGIYFVRVLTDEGSCVKKLVVR